MKTRTRKIGPKWNSDTQLLGCYVYEGEERFYFSFPYNLDEFSLSMDEAKQLLEFLNKALKK